MRGLKQYECDESKSLRMIINQMNYLHATMGGRDNRPERKALIKAIKVLQDGIQKAMKEAA